MTLLQTESDSLVWLHGTGFEGALDAWLDDAVGRIRVGRFTTADRAGRPLRMAHGGALELGTRERLQASRLSRSQTRQRGAAAPANVDGG